MSAAAMWDNSVSMSTARAETLAAEFLNRHFASGEYARHHISELARMATSPDRQEAESASRAIFKLIAEPLADSFEPAAVTLYNRCFAQIIQSCRRARPELDRELARFGLNSEGDILERAERLRRQRKMLAPAEDPSAIIALSRVTIGADVAITSVMLERLKRRFPKSDIFLIGSDKLIELFGGDDRLKFRKLDYDRAGTLSDRLLAWLNLLNQVRELIGGFSSDRFIVIDPDSRLTQLGLLPLVPDESYLFFPSREYGAESDLPLGRLASNWLNEVFAEEVPSLPRLSLRRSDLEVASELTARLKRAGTAHIAVVNFGVGGDPTKRIGDQFERQIVAHLLGQGATVILDKGAGEEESHRAEAIARSVRNELGEKARAIECGPENIGELLAKESIDSNLVILRGGAGSLAAMISRSDLYIGYDSAGQHIAAALGTPCIDIFSGNRPPRFSQRWRPVGPSRIEAVRLETSVEDLLAKIKLLARELLTNR